MTQVVGVPPRTCPWAALWRPIVRDAMTVHALRDRGGIGELLMGGPEVAPRRLVEAAATFEMAHKRAELWERENQEQERRQREEHQRRVQQRRGGAPAWTRRMLRR